MKKFLPLLACTLVLLTFDTPALAKTNKPTTTVQKQTTSKPTEATKKEEAAMVAKVEYQLPYPGILPDHPLWILKAIRDRIMDFLIADPVRKSEFYILQADKRLGMAMMLLDKGNITLAEITLSKGETYMEKAVSTLINYKGGGRQAPGYLVDRATLSLAKHSEVLSQRLSTAADPARAFLSAAVEKVKTLETQAEKMK